MTLLSVKESTQIKMKEFSCTVAPGDDARASRNKVKVGAQCLFQGSAPWHTEVHAHVVSHPESSGLFGEEACAHRLNRDLDTWSRTPTAPWAAPALEPSAMPGPATSSFLTAILGVGTFVLMENEKAAELSNAFLGREHCSSLRCSGDPQGHLCVATRQLFFCAATALQLRASPPSSTAIAQ